jgi:transcriptional regulator with XRE-family HTH domain
MRTVGALVDDRWKGRSAVYLDTFAGNPDSGCGWRKACGEHSQRGEEVRYPLPCDGGSYDVGDQTKDDPCGEFRRSEQAPTPSAKDLDALLVEVGHKVATLRRQCELTQEQLAQRAGCSTNTVIALESGKRNVTVRNLAMISAAFQIPVGDLFPKEAEANAQADTISALSGEIATAQGVLEKVQGLIGQLRGARSSET